LHINIWDFGGQEYYHATHRLFLDDHAVYLVVWETDTNIQGVQDTEIYLLGQQKQLPLEYFHYSYWLESVLYYAPESKLLLVQTKTDKNGSENAEEVCFKKPYSVQSPDYHVSIQDANSYKEDLEKTPWAEFIMFESKLIETLRKDAAKYLLGAKWVEIRDRIRQNPPAQFVISYEDFEVFCRKIDPTIEIKGLMAYLGGSASTILHYENDRKLNKIVFLNPQWVIDTIYAILSYDIRELNKGEFTRTHVDTVLSQKGIRSMTDTFLELMKANRFELIFEKPNFADTYIAPQYLPEVYNDVDALYLLRSTLPVSFTLHFPSFMPKSVFIRFMVLYGDQAKYIYWKNGIVLNKEGVRIAAECLFLVKKIKVSIEHKPLAKQLAKELFDVFWRLSDEKPKIEVSVDETDFVEIGELKDCLNQIQKVKSKQGNWIPVNKFRYLFERSYEGEAMSDPTETK
jgi:internalin A